MPSSPIIAPTITSNYPPSTDRVTNDHDPHSISSSHSKRSSELFSILDDHSELRKLCDDDNNNNNNNNNSSTTTSLTTTNSHKISSNEMLHDLSVDRSSHGSSHQQKIRSSTTGKRVTPRKKQRSSDMTTTSSSCSSYSTKSLTIDCEGSSEYVTTTTPCRKSSMHYYHPYNLPSIYENSSKVKHKKGNLRSLAPVLYDLLSDDCEAENRDRSTTMPYSSTLANELCRSVDFYLNPLPLPLPLVATSTLPMLAPHHDQRPIAYFNNLMQQSLLMNSSPMNLLKMVQQPNDSSSNEWPTVTSNALTQPQLNRQLCKEFENLPTEQSSHQQSQSDLHRQRSPVASPQNSLVIVDDDIY